MQRYSLCLKNASKNQTIFAKYVAKHISGSKTPDKHYLLRPVAITTDVKEIART
jgi:hypothetical protein